MTDFKIGDRVRIKPGELDGFKTNFRRFVAGKVGAVLALPRLDYLRGKVRVEFLPSKGRGEPRREWIDERYIELAEPDPS